jgi:predicted phosphohydrolase
MFFRRESHDLAALINRRPPSAVERFLASPIQFIADVLCDRFGLFTFKPSKPQAPTAGPGIRVVCISDTHGKQPQIPEGDLLIHAGDLTVSGSQHEIQSALDWLCTLPHRHKVVIGGNHDTFLASESPAASQLKWHHGSSSLVYLQDSSIVLDFPGNRRLKIYGSPRTPQHGSGVFQYPRNTACVAWEGAVPVDIDVLITHGPPFAHQDLNGLGCKGLLRELWRVRPRLHVFGHIHAGHGIKVVRFDDVQAGYEDICAGQGVRGLAKMIWGLLCRLCEWGRLDEENYATVLVNAAIVGGLRDELLREAIVIQI